MSQAVTTDILNNSLQRLGRSLREEMRENTKEITREITSHFNTSQDKQSQWIRDEFEVVNTKLDAIMSGEVFVIRPQAKSNLRS